VPRRLGSSRKCWTPQPLVLFSSVMKVAMMQPGGVAGGQIGYRWQSRAWVFGLEAQGDWANLRRSNAEAPASS